MRKFTIIRVTFRRAAPTPGQHGDFRGAAARTKRKRMQLRRGNRTPRLALLGTTLFVLAFLVLGSLGVAPALQPASDGGMHPASSATAVSAADVAIGPLSNATQISSAFWGVNVPTAQRFNTTDAAAVAATPVTYTVYPAGLLGEEFNYTSGILTRVNGSTQVASTTAAEFVTACKSIGCHAILQLPAEINSTSTVVYYVNYVVHTLGFQPDYWEIGNAPSGWVHYNVPWSAWGTTQGGNTTPVPFAQLVKTYITAIRAVDPGAKFLALGAGMGGSNYDRAWVQQLAKVDGQLLAGIAVHSYVEGSPSNPTDADLLANLHGVYSLPDQVSADRKYIASACPNCSQLSVFVTEINAAENSNYLQLLPTFAGTLYLAAEIVQGFSLHVTNLDWFAYDSHFPGSWCSHPLQWQSQYYLFYDIANQLGSETLPTTVSGAPTLYSMATYGESNLALLLVNVNTTASVQANISEAGFATSGPITQYAWTNATARPVVSQIANTNSVTLPPMSIYVLKAAVTTSSASSPPDYPVTFTETGLPAGSPWSVTLNGVTNQSTTDAVGFSEPNGSYAYTIAPASGYLLTRSNGTVTVPGAPATVGVVFSLPSNPQYPVTFTETGLAPGVKWSIVFGGQNGSSSTNTIEFFEPNGSFPYTIAALPNYTTNRASGSVNVSGAPAGVNVSFVAVSGTYPVTFSESGLPGNLTWSVEVAGVWHDAAAGASVIVLATNGTYSFRVGSVTGYGASPAKGQVKVHGAGVSTVISFASSASGSHGHIHSVRGVVQVSNGTTIADLGLSMTFLGGQPVVQWLNLTTNASGQFSVTGLNISGNLSGIDLATPRYQVLLTNITWPVTDGVALTIVLRLASTASSPGGVSEIIQWLSSVVPFGLATVGLGAFLAVLVGMTIRGRMRRRRRARYQQYFGEEFR